MPGKRIALVIAGGGARGAYEAGALSVILPELERRDERPTLYLGASVGTLNAAVLASRHDQGAEAQVEYLLDDVALDRPGRRDQADRCARRRSTPSSAWASCCRYPG